MISPSTSLRELAFIVGTALNRANITAVLSGGGAATVYAPEANQSHDLDFILEFWSSLGSSNRCILDLGFSERNGLYRHPNTKFTLEFPPGPLNVGEEVIRAWSTLRENEMVLNILSPTDCVRDRLLPFLSGTTNVDYSALEQALAVAAAHEIDLKRIHQWAISEGIATRYPIFERRYRALPADA